MTPSRPHPDAPPASGASEAPHASPMSDGGRTRPAATGPGLVAHSWGTGIDLAEGRRLALDIAPELAVLERAVDATSPGLTSEARRDAALGLALDRRVGLVSVDMFRFLRFCLEERGPPS